MNRIPLVPTLLQRRLSLSMPGTQTYISIRHRYFGSSSFNDDDEYENSDVLVQTLGDMPYGSREYVVTLAPHLAPTTLANRVASIRAHRNIIFGAKSYNGNAVLSTTKIGPVLLRRALQDAGSEGEQPQAMCTLRGLSKWVQQHLRSLDGESHDELSSPNENVIQLLVQMDEAQRAAVRAIATGTPRPGHSVVGAGTYRDGEEGWTALAREYATNKSSVPVDEELQLYQLTPGATLVRIEHMAGTQEAYLKEAGGAMARFFFL